MTLEVRSNAYFHWLHHRSVDLFRKAEGLTVPDIPVFGDYVMAFSLADTQK